MTTTSTEPSTEARLDAPHIYSNVKVDEIIVDYTGWESVEIDITDIPAVVTGIDRITGAWYYQEPDDWDASDGVSEYVETRTLVIKCFTDETVTLTRDWDYCWLSSDGQVSLDGETLTVENGMVFEWREPNYLGFRFGDDISPSDIIFLFE